MKTTTRANKMQYDTIMSNVSPFMTDGEGANKKILTGTATIPIQLCFIDERYQGYRRHEDIDRLVSNWDKTKLQPITVVPHPEECRFAVVDGKGRCIAASTMGIDKLNAIIVMCAPEDVEERLKYEANFFISQDDQVSIVREPEKHLSRVLLGDESAIALDDVLKRYNIGIKNVHRKDEYDVRISYTEMDKIAKSGGVECLEFILSVLCNAGWDKERSGLITRNIRALKNTWIYAKPEMRERIAGCLTEEFKHVSPDVFHARAKERYPMREDRIAVTIYMQDIVCEKLSIDNYMTASSKNGRSYIEAA